jgi:hypothetical protein
VRAYLIGTNKTGSVGGFVSYGCIRMYNMTDRPPDAARFRADNDPANVQLVLRNALDEEGWLAD